jgi:hypothetical protein
MGNACQKLGNVCGKGKEDKNPVDIQLSIYETI